MAGGLLFAGCSLSGPPDPTRFDPQQAGQVAMETYDANADGELGETELDKVLSLKGALARVDTNRDGAMTAEEIAARIGAYESQSDYVGTSILVFAAGQPCAGATVTLELEPFMGSDFQSFVGKTNERGATEPAGEQAITPGLPTGFYRVRILKPGSNDEIVRGCEIADDVPNANRLTFSL